MEQKKVVIIVPFVSLNDYVVECINGCLALNYSNFRLILLPNKSIELPLKLNTDRVTVRPTGDIIIAKKRNIAIDKFPDTDYYAFIDSDAYPHSDWLKNGTESFLKSDIIWAVGGPDIGPDYEPLYQKVVGNAQKSFLVSGLATFCKKDSKSRCRFNLHSCNLIVKKEAMQLLGGFNEKLEIGEDQAFCSRIRNHNKKLFYNNMAIVYHHNRPVGMPFFLQKMIHGYSVFDVVKCEKALFNFWFFIPLLWLLVLIIGFIFSFTSRIIMLIWSTIVSLYISAAIIDTIRYSKKITEMPLSFIAILIGNLGYPTGSLLTAMRVKLNIKKIYGNYSAGSIR